MYRSPTPPRALRFVVAVIALALLSAVASGTAAAKTKTCADQVVADWFDDGRVDKLYPLDCYRKAIKSLPLDLVVYGNAAEEIGRALAFAKQGKPDPGGKDPTPATTGTTPTETTRTTTTPTDTTPTDSTLTDTTPTDTSGPSSVPIPLLVLGGLAVLLLAAGSAGYLRRRMGSDDDGSGTPPASA